MKKGILFLSALLMAFTVLLVPVEVQASELSLTDIKHKAYAMGLSNFAIVTHDSSTFVLSKPFIQVYGVTNSIFHDSSYKVQDGNLVSISLSYPSPSYYDYVYSTHDIMNRNNDTVFFSGSLDPVPKALAEVLPNLLAQALKIIPVAVMILGAMMGVSLISRVLYRYL